MEKEMKEILSAVIEAASDDGICEDDRCFNALQRLKQNLLVHQDRFSVFQQVGNYIHQLAKHPREKISCLASDVIETCKSNIDSPNTVELHGLEIASLNPGGVIMKPQNSELDETCSGENSKTRKEDSRTENVDLFFGEEKKHEDRNEKNTIQVVGGGGGGGGVVVPKLNSVPLTKETVRDQVREMVAEAMCKVSTEVVNDDDLQKQVSACDPYRTAALLETITFEKWGRFDGPQVYKYRCLMHNLKDPSNPDFRRKILLGQLPAHSIVELKWEEMGSDERQKRIRIMKDRALIKLPRFDVWSCCLNSCTCKYPESSRRYLRCPIRGINGNHRGWKGLNVGHRGWKRIGRRPKMKKRIACGSTK